MRTDELIDLLASDGGVARSSGSGAAARMLGLALLFGAALSLCVLIATLGVRPDLGTALAVPVTWGKRGFALALLVVAFAMLQRLARPGPGLSRRHAAALLLPIGALWLVGLSSYAGAPAEARAALLWGQSWQACAALIALLALPFGPQPGPLWVLMPAAMLLRLMSAPVHRHLAMCALARAGHTAQRLGERSPSR